MLEAICTKCDETFIPADETDLEHFATGDGQECGGQGELLGQWIFPVDADLVRENERRAALVLARSEGLAGPDRAMWEARDTALSRI